METRSGMMYPPAEKVSLRGKSHSLPARDRNDQRGGDDVIDTKSRTSRSSRQSRQSSAAIKARAKVEAARALQTYAEREAQLMRKRAEFEAEIHLLQSQKALAAAAAEVAVFEEAESINESDGASQQDISLHLEEECPKERTEDFIENHFLKNQPDTNDETTDGNKGYNMSELAECLARKDLGSNLLVKFDEKPGNYRAWKASFLGVIQNLKLTPREQLDLLVKWLGEESSQQAKRIRAVNPTNSQAGLDLVWERLEETYGAPEVVEEALIKKIANFPKITTKDSKRLRELGDIVLELECAKSDGTLPGLAYLDTARGVQPIIEKLPHNLQERWMNKGSQYKRDHKVPFPPFSFLSKFIREEAKVRNDPSFAVPRAMTDHKPVRVNITETKEPPRVDNQCPIHKAPHPLPKCRAFLSKSVQDRKAFLKENRICFRCLSTTNHISRNCKETVKCEECGSGKHSTALHLDYPQRPTLPQENLTTSRADGGEGTSNSVTSNCTEVCGQLKVGGRSCSKICPVEVYPTGREHETMKVYAVLDEQSNRSLARPQLFDALRVDSQVTPYTLKTCSGTRETAGRRVNNLTIRSIDGKVTIDLPTLIECDSIPDDRTEIPSPEIAVHFSHLKRISDKIPDVDPAIPILLLLGRDVIRAHKVREQINGPHDAPYAQRLDLGWVIVGETCLGMAHRPNGVNVYKANVLTSGRPSHMQPCHNAIQVKERSIMDNQMAFPSATDDGKDLFVTTRHDEKVAPSADDRAFLNIMDEQVFKDDLNNWVAPLPFRSDRRRLPNNRQQALKRLYSLRKTLLKDLQKKDKFLQFVQKMIDNGHAEVAPSLDDHVERWYLPMFGVHHPQKPEQIRVVFDSSAEYEGVSLNSTLLSGPDLNNTLLGVLMRFRREPIAISADVQQMFYCFYVREDHRDFLRFLWFKDNDMSNEIIEYRMKVHVFGNSPSPSVAVYCMQKAAREGEMQYGSDVTSFVVRDFYVDDGLSSAASDREAVNLLTRTKEMLAESNINLHKFAFNSSVVLEAFQAEDRAKDIKDLDLSSDPLPLQRSLGLMWDLESDAFAFNVPTKKGAFTRRGVLSIINSLYDPLGFAAPITLKGKAMLRELTLECSGWDVPLSAEREEEWNAWRESLRLLEHLRIPRCYTLGPLSSYPKKELCIFSDTSTIAVGAVAYLKATDNEGYQQVGFLMGKSKLAPKPAHTIPRLEMCAAVLAVEIFDVINEELDVEVDAVKFFTDSKIVLGYINNSTRRFHVYVANRVNRIRRSSHPSQWRYVSTDRNPADLASRSVAASDLQGSIWFTGPEFLSRKEDETPETTYDLVDPDNDNEIRLDVKPMLTKTIAANLGAHRFQRFSSWECLYRVVARLITAARSFKKPPDESTGATSEHSKDQCETDDMASAKSVAIRCVQHEAFSDELKCLGRREELPKRSVIRRLNPIIDENGVMRVGGRLSASELPREQTHPVIIPRAHHLATLIVRYYHERVAHQGRHITEGTVRAAGYWIVGGKGLISGLIHKCVTCRKLRGKNETQMMPDLPADRAIPGPPFTSVGIDVFGPWNVITRKTRGGSAESKRWAVIFSCMSSRAVHIEVLESLSTSSFINALRRFFAIRGPAKILRSDRGTNFVGAYNELHMISGTTEVKRHLQGKGCVWIFNPPHASHMGGAWERMIGIARRILDSMLLHNKFTRLTHEVLSTLMAEVTAIMNSRPLVPVSSDPDKPEVLTPAMLLTQKVDNVSAPAGNFDTATLHTKQWKQVQCLAETFWKRWKSDYLSSLQGRSKWTVEKRILRAGDVVLLKDEGANRNDWPVGLIDKVHPSEDGRVRKVDVRVVVDGTPKVYLRPISKVVLLVESE